MNNIRALPRNVRSNIVFNFARYIFEKDSGEPPFYAGLRTPEQVQVLLSAARVLTFLIRGVRAFFF